MAEHYVSALASGGAGTVGDPWDLSTFITNFNNATVADGSDVWMKADGTYITTTVTLTNPGSASAETKIEGYTTATGDGGKATIQRSGSTGRLIDASGSNYLTFQSLILDGQDAGTENIYGSSYTLYKSIESHSAGSVGIQSGRGAENCYSHDNGSIGINAMTTTMNCIAVNNGSFGIYSGSICNCISKGNNNNYGYPSLLVNCISDTPSANYGARINVAGHIYNCIFYGEASGKQAIYDDSAYLRSHLFNNNNFYNVTTKSNNDANLRTYYELDPQFTDRDALDYTRTGTNLDGKGFSTVGALIDYDVDVGVGRVSSVPSVPTFAGITQLEAIGGRLRASWSAGTGTIDTYNVYIRNGSSTDLFTSTYLLDKLANTLTSTIFTTEADGATLLQSTSTYYVGIRAENSGGEDTNTVSLSASADGDGSAPLTINETPFALGL